MATSENGWPVLDATELTWFTAAHERFAAANADAAFLAQRLINRFTVEVEPLAGPVRDDWSWADRPVRGRTTGFSNHASACAWDLNATKHPRGVHGTFTAAQIKAVRAILADIRDGTGRMVFRWGNDYTHAPIDAMHFEIVVPPADLAGAARILRARLAVIAAAKAQEDDVSFRDEHTLTAWDVAAYGDPTRKVGDKMSYDEIVRNPPGLGRLRREMAAAAAAQALRDAEQAARITSLVTQLTALNKAVIALNTTAVKPAGTT